MYNQQYELFQNFGWCCHLSGNMWTWKLLEKILGGAATCRKMWTTSKLIGETFGGAAIWRNNVNYFNIFRELFGGAAICRKKCYLLQNF
jgi:hypothetical protein